MSTVSVSRDQERLNTYDVLATAVGYPGDRFFERFPDLSPERDRIVSEYDGLFRNQGIWLYTSEYTTRGEFQQSNCLSDIMGFYRAFGLKIEKERPDGLSVELEFMHFLIFKVIYANENLLENREEKAQICLDAQRKFFAEFLHPGAVAIAEKINSSSEADYYREVFEEIALFVAEEQEYMDELERGTE